MADFVECKHCQAAGTCKSGANDKSCAVCREFWREKWYKTYAKELKDQRAPQFQESDGDGFVCSVCRGLGVVEMPSTKWDYRFPAILALLFIIATFWLIYYFDGSKDASRFQQVLVFASTLIGSITGYYFAGARRSGLSVQPVKKVP